MPGDIRKARELFLKFSEQAKDSGIYEYLSKRTSEDSAVLATIPIHATQPTANLFFGAINFLLYKNPEAELRHFFPNQGGKTSLTQKFYDIFEKFYQKYQKEVHQIMNTRLVQTNEVRRCAALMAAVSLANEKSDQPVALVDVGTSSGLNLLMDQYHVRYSDGFEFGKLNSELILECDSKNTPRLSTPIIASRVGIDLNPIDLKDEDEKLWALSLIWPDQLERIDRLKKAIEILSRQRVNLRKGNALELLKPLGDEIPQDQHLCFMHSFVLNQFSPEDRHTFKSQLIEISKSRKLSRISFEWIDTELPEIVLEHFADGKIVKSQKLADAHHHGEWLRWV
jgi:hypothetical protein